MMRPIPQDIQESVKALFNQSCYLRIIQRIFPDLSLSVLSRCRKKFLGHSKHAKPGRRSKSNTQNMNYMEGNLCNGKLDDPRGVQCYPAHMRVQMTLRNIQYILKRKGFEAKRKVETNFVPAKNQKKRLVWAKRHHYLTTDDWRKWGFSDETRVNMWGSDGKSFYWTHRPTELMPQQTEAQIQRDSGGAVFWGMISADGLNYGSTFTEGTANLEVYAKILELSLLEDTMEYYGVDKKSLDSSKIMQDHTLLVSLKNGSDITDSLCKLFSIGPLKTLISTPLNMSGIS